MQNFLEQCQNAAGMTKSHFFTTLQTHSLQAHLPPQPHQTHTLKFPLFTIAEAGAVTSAL